MLPVCDRCLCKQRAGMLKGGRRVWRVIVVAVAFGVLALALFLLALQFIPL